MNITSKAALFLINHWKVILISLFVLGNSAYIYSLKHETKDLKIQLAACNVDLKVTNSNVSSWRATSTLQNNKIDELNRAAKEQAEKSKKDIDQAREDGVKSVKASNTILQSTPKGKDACESANILINEQIK